MVISNKISFICMNYVLPQNRFALSVTFPTHILGKYALQNFVLNIFEMLRYEDVFSEINLSHWQIFVLFFTKTHLLIFTFQSHTQR